MHVFLFCPFYFYHEKLYMLVHILSVDRQSDRALAATRRADVLAISWRIGITVNPSLRH